MLKLRALSIFALVGAGCIGTKTPPAPSEQAEVTYGDRIYVADQGNGPGGICAFAGPSTTSSTADGMISTFFGKELRDPDYSAPSRMFHNCYIHVQPGTLRVDKFAVSNDQYQLCVDSDFCTDPDPSDVERERVCSSTDDDFWYCPVVGLTRDQAARYCEFVGLRLPSGFEHMTFRTGAASSPDAVLEFPREGGEPSTACVEAILDGCGSQVTPMGLGSATPVGAAANDKLGGIYDLTGNEREWSRDLVAVARPQAVADLPWELPWFCIAPVSTSTSMEDWPTTCPDAPEGFPDYTCVYGRRMLPDGSFRDDLPVCIVPTSLVLENGAIPASFGSGIEHDPALGRGHLGIGPYVRTPFSTGVEFVNRGVGFRCVGNAGDPVAGSLVSAAGP